MQCYNATNINLMNNLTVILIRKHIFLFKRQVPEGTGWIMDGFPSSINQAKVFSYKAEVQSQSKKVVTSLLVCYELVLC